MVDIDSIRKVDKANMLEILLDLPMQCKRAKALGKYLDLPQEYSNFDNILFTGQGGSAIGADIIRSFLAYRVRVPIEVNRNYIVPSFVNSKTLAFVCSYSGNTEESLSAYKRLKKSGARIIALTSDGKLASWADADRLPCIMLPQGIPPRCAIGYMVLTPLVVLAKMGLIGSMDREIAQTVEVLERLKNERLAPEIGGTKNIARKIASLCYKKFVIIYGSDDCTGPVVTRWRQDLNENSKILCSSHIFPELDHNEITGWEDAKHISKDFLVVILRDRNEHPRVKLRIQISKRLIKRKAKRVIEVSSQGKGPLSRIFSLIYIGSMVSFYLAVLNGVDPTPVDNVTYLKRELAKA